MYVQQPQYPKFEQILGLMSGLLVRDYPDSPAALLRMRTQWLTTLRPSSIRTFTDDLRRWAAWCGGASPTEPVFSVRALQNYVAALEFDGLKPRTIGRYLCALNLARTAVQPDDADADKYLRGKSAALARSTLPSTRDVHEMDSLTREHLEALASTADTFSIQDTRALAIAWLLYDTQLPPLRIFGQAVGKTWVLPPLSSAALTNTDQGYQLTLRASAMEPAARRDVGDQSMLWIGRYHELRGPDDLIFTNRYGHPFRKLRWIDDVRHLAARAGLGALRIGMSSCRRGAAKDLFLSGASAREVCRAANWVTFQPLLRLSKECFSASRSPQASVPMPSLPPAAFEPVINRMFRAPYRSRRFNDGLPPHMGDLFAGLDSGGGN